MRLVIFSLIGLVSCTRTPETTQPKIQIGEAPIADAGSAATVTSDQPIFLDGAASFDPDGHAISYHWSFGRVPEGSLLDETAFSLNASAEPTTSFLADTAGTYIIELMVVDETELESLPDSVIITVTEGQLPTANAGTDLEIMQGDTITLNGSGSADPLGRPLTYSWAIADKPETSLLDSVDSPTALETTFTPDEAGIYLLSLTVNNGINDSAPDVVVLRVASSNPIAPTALVGDDITDSEDCTSIQLNGSGSYDPNGDSLDYLWTLQSKPTESSASNNSFSDTTAVQPTFYADVAGEYVVSLSVNDGNEWSSPDMLTITAVERVSNASPTVNAGSSLSVDAGDGLCELSGYSYICDECDPVTLTIGTGGSVVDPDGDPVTYEWQVISGDVSISDPNSLETLATFEGATPTDINVCENNSYELELVAVDCPGASSIDSITVTLSCCGLEDTSSN